MDFNYNKYSIKGFFNTKKKYIVPRYQREYSWGDYELKEFFNDIVTNIVFDEKNNKLKDTEYYFGNLLFVGDFAGNSKSLDIIDGQQRITTFTIFLSILAKKFYEINENKIGDVIWEYIMAKDDDGNEYAVLVNDTPNPYFQYLVQTKDLNNNSPIAPRMEEEDNIKKAYTYFSKELSKSTLTKTFKNVFNKQFEYVDLLKALRDQLINSFIICIWTTDLSHAGKIFETLNAKGKELASIDLIKNNIFEKLSKTQPTDDALNKWKTIIRNLSSEENRISMSTFFRHYWISKYKKCTENKLYDQFLRTFSKKNANEYSKFLEDLIINSKVYMSIIKPKIEDYNGRVEKRYIVQSLQNINNVFNVTQTRVILLSILTTYHNGLISDKQLKKILNYIENFHFVYTGLCTLRPNKLENTYSKFAILLRESKSKDDSDKIINDLIKEMNKSFPKYSLFKENFLSKLTFTKQEKYANILTKYVVNKLENYFSERDVNRDDASIEHIISEDANNEITLSIGNLILLETKINNEIPSGSTFEEKTLKFYDKSSYKQIKSFCTKYKNFSIEDIKDRTEKLCDLYYEKILSRKILEESI